MRRPYGPPLALLAALIAHGTQPARADVPVLVRAPDVTDDGAALEAAIARLRAWSRTPSTSARALLERAPMPGATPADLRTLYAVEAALDEARRRASELDERAALAAVARAERSAPALVAMPGGRVFLAEIEITLALVAWQLGDRALAEASLARALSLDPRRRLRAADADPDLVARADALLAAIERRPREPLVVRADVEASVFVDDVLVGRTPLRAEVRAGEHVVRVVAPEHAPYAIRLYVTRATTLDLALSPTPAARHLVRLERALDAAAHDAAAFDEVVELLGALAAEGHVVEAALVRGDALVVCDRGGCTAAVEADGTGPLPERDLSPRAAWATLGDPAASMRADRSVALRERRRRDREARVRRRRILGIAGGIVGAGVVTTVGLVARPTPERLRVDVTFD